MSAYYSFSPPPVELTNRIVIGQLSQMQSLLISINAVRKCATPACRGIVNYMHFAMPVITILTA